MVVSEHSKNALLYDISKLGHAHPVQDQEVSKVGEVTRLNTFITVLDTAEFYHNLEGMKYYNKRKIVELMMKLLAFGNTLWWNWKDTKQNACQWYNGPHNYDQSQC